MRHDGRWSLGIWLRVDALLAPFARLCQDLVDASRDIDPLDAGAFVMARLARWRRLLETGTSALSITELRGLLGELIVLRHCLDVWAPAEVVEGWVGPLEAPQDFVLPSLWIEAKATYPSASVIRISSVDQLDVAGRMVLAVATLTTLPSEVEGFSLASLVDEIRQRLTRASAYGAALEFDSRLAAGGFADGSAYGRPMFRLDDLRFFGIGEGFPLIRRSDLPAGVAEASYEIELGACSAFQIPLAK